MSNFLVSKQSLSLPRLQVLSQHKEWFKPYHGTADFSPHPILTDFYSHFFNLCQSQPLCAVDTGCGAVAGSSVAANTSWCWVVIVNLARGSQRSGGGRLKQTNGVVTQACMIHSSSVAGTCELQACITCYTHSIIQTHCGECRPQIAVNYEPFKHSPKHSWTIWVNTLLIWCWLH